MPRLKRDLPTIALFHAHSTDFVEFPESSVTAEKVLQWTKAQLANKKRGVTPQLHSVVKRAADAHKLYNHGLEPWQATVLICAALVGIILVAYVLSHIGPAARRRDRVD
jgi:hypothetical protein